MRANAYEQAGVRGQGDALSAVSRHLGPTLGLPADAEVVTSFGHYASVLKLSEDVAIAISTDGVGSKTMIAAALGRYETIGFDCMAMNVNDVICVGARPVALVDYLGVNTLDEDRTDAILRGLGDAAREAGVAIPGGEIAQLPEVIGSDGRAPGDEAAFDLVGTCVGTLHPARLTLGHDITPGDALVGIASSGIHSNGLTLARRALLDGAGYGLADVVPELGRTLGDELLEPTAIYVRAVTSLWDEGIETRGLAHVTSDGLANLCRLEAPVGYDVEELPEPPAIFTLIQRAAGIEAAEMYRVFNMGIGFVVIVPEAAAEDAAAVIGRAGYRPFRIGTVTSEPGVRVLPAGLEGSLTDGESVFRPAR